jgi:hypothetical protein
MFDVSDEMIQARDSDSNYVWYGFTFDSVKKHTFSKIFSIAPLSSSRFGLQGCSFVVAMVAKKNYGVGCGGGVRRSRRPWCVDAHTDSIGRKNHLSKKALEHDARRDT